MFRTTSNRLKPLLLHRRPLFRRLATESKGSVGSSRRFPLVWSALAGAGLGSAYLYYYQNSKSSTFDSPASLSDNNNNNNNNTTPIKPSDNVGGKHFNSKDTTVVFVLGGPGAGKGTQCENIVRDYGFIHLSAGDLLRAERNRPGSKYGKLINDYIREGLIVPMEITIALLETAMKESGGRRFLIDGFPRAMDQALKFEETVVKSKMVLYFECPEEEMMIRLLKRGETSGRVDDNEDSIKKRFKTFRETSYPVIEHYAKHGKVAAISCLNSKENVYRDVRRVFENLLARANIAELPSDDPNGYVAIEEQIPISGNHNHQTQQQ